MPLVGARRAAIAVVAASAVVAILAGLTRLGWNIPLASSRATEHGPLLVLGVFGTLISLERAVALGAPWAYAAPAAGALGALAAVAGLREPVPYLALLEGVFLVAANVAIVHRQATTSTRLMLLGSVVLVGGTGAWLAGRPIFTVVPTWLAFFVLTIVAERIEMSRLAPVPRWAGVAILVACLTTAASVLVALVLPSLAVRVFGASLVVIAAWELRFDLARRTLRQRGLPRFAASGVLAGAAWLGVSGAGLVALGLPVVGPVYDALLHAVFVGFVVSMVFAHAPIILPAVARVRVAFGPAFYAPLLLLHAALVARILGDLLGVPSLRSAGGLGNALAIALFVVVVVLSRAAPASSEARPRSS
jgi:hypothetical protein